MLKWISKKWDGLMDWIDLAQDRERWRAVVNAVMNLRAPLNAGNFLIVWGPVSFSRRILLQGVSFTNYFNTFTAIVDLSRSNFSIARTPLFQLKSAM